MSDPNPKQDEEPKVPRDGEVEDRSLEEVAGGFDPCPEPPGFTTRSNPATRCGVPITLIKR
jgi:hypothetical protein